MASRVGVPPSTMRAFTVAVRGAKLGGGAEKLQAWKRKLEDGGITNTNATKKVFNDDDGIAVLTCTCTSHD